MSVMQLMQPNDSNLAASPLTPFPDASIVTFFSLPVYTTQNLNETIVRVSQCEVIRRYWHSVISTRSFGGVFSFQA